MKDAISAYINFLALEGSSVRGGAPACAKCTAMCSFPELLFSLDNKDRTRCILAKLFVAGFFAPYT